MVDVEDLHGPFLVVDAVRDPVGAPAGAVTADVDPAKLAATLRGCSGGSAALDLVSMM